MTDEAAAAPHKCARFPAWSSPVALVVVLVISLVIGSGVTSTGPPSASARVAAIEAAIRCPSCEDLSVAQSSASSALAVRHEVSRMAAAGDGSTAIEHTLVAQYGPTILLRPPTHGLVSLVWDIPIAAGILGVGGLAIVFRRRARAFARLGESAEASESS